MSEHFQIVVSAENNSYLSWQCKLFYFSCVTRTNHQPIIIVHDSGRDWHPDFYDLTKAGCAVYPAPSYRINPNGYDYACRNFPGTLIQAANVLRDRDVFIVLCDPDMIFTRPLQFPKTLSGDFCSYMNYDRDFVIEAKRRLGIRRELSPHEKETLRCGVPYVIPIQQAAQIGSTWIEAIDLFTSRNWGDIMYAFGLAVTKLDLKVNLTHLVDHNYWPDEKLKAPMIHYCHGDERWNKRHYCGDQDGSGVWNPPDGAQGTILGELFTLIREAREFYRDSYFPSEGRPNSSS
jgi:hypothetical protein